MPEFVYESTIPSSLDEVFAWHRRPGALLRLTPPWLPARVVHESSGLAVGDRVRFKLGPLTIESEHTALTTPAGGTAEFVDEMRGGPFRRWHHSHQFMAADDGTVMRDVIHWEARWLPASIVTSQLRRMFGFRHRQLAADLAAHARTPQRLRVAISGASGLLGTQLAALLSTGGHEVFRLVRRPVRLPDEIHWDPADDTIERDKLLGCDAVVHLAGEPLFGRWTATKMRKIRESRLRGTEFLARTLADIREAGGPTALVGASAVGYYANSAEPIAEDGARGTGFLAELVTEWEQAADPARAANIRVVNPRLGLVLSPRGGMLGMQLPAFRAGLGGQLGDGKQWFSWVSHDDAIGLLHHGLGGGEISGPLNVVAPTPVTSRQFARELGAVLHRPALIPVPVTAIKVALGSVAARELVAASQRVIPRKAEATGYRFRHPELRAALRYLLGRETV